ncbi:hypothetical protein ACFL5G_02950 [Candidatus Margulisiibacteriota bacterium]
MRIKHVIFFIVFSITISLLHDIYAFSAKPDIVKNDRVDQQRVTMVNLEYDLGEVIEGRIVTADIALEDTIKKIISSCDCISASSSGNIVSLKIRTVGERGAFHKIILVECARKNYRIAIVGDIQPKRKQILNYMEDR